jgi:hypothetical protein
MPNGNLGREARVSLATQPTSAVMSEDKRNLIASQRFLVCGGLAQALESRTPLTPSPSGQPLNAFSQSTTVINTSPSLGHKKEKEDHPWICLSC